jgi:hypothetical protein
MKAYGGVDVLIHVFLISALVGSQEVSYTPRTLYPRGKSPRYPLDRRLGGPQNRSGRRGEEENLAATGTRTPTSQPSSPLPVAIPTMLSRLLYRMKMDIISVEITCVQPLGRTNYGRQRKRWRIYTQMV